MEASGRQGKNAAAPLRRRFWAELTLAATSTALLLVTIVWPDWIELAFGADPDHGDGSVEWLVVGLALLVSAIFSTLAHAEWRRTRPALGR
jgi:hypothetical protein